MPGFIAKKLCPELVIVKTHFEKYREVSQQVQEILIEYDPNFAMMSLDEAYIDFTPHIELRQNLLEQERTFSKMPKYATCICKVNANSASSASANNSNQAASEGDKICNSEQLVSEISGEISGESNGLQCSITFSNTDLDVHSKSDSAVTDISKLEQGRSKDSHTDLDDSALNKLQQGSSESSSKDSNTEQMVVGNSALNKVEQGSCTDSTSVINGKTICDSCGLERWEARKEDEVTFGFSLEDAVKEMRFRIEQKTWLTASAGNLKISCFCYLTVTLYNE